MKMYALHCMLVLCVSFVIGCATTYQKQGFSGGYTDIQYDKNTFLVTFKGNGYISSEKVSTYALYRCAEITILNGFDYFIIVDSNNLSGTSFVTTPGSFQSNTFGSTTTGTFTPGQTRPIRKYGASLRIKLFRGDKPENNYDAYNAFELKRYLRSSIKR